MTKLKEYTFVIRTIYERLLYNELSQLVVHNVSEKANKVLSVVTETLARKKEGKVRKSGWSCKE